MIFIFLAVVYILLINLLIAMMGDTYGFVASIPNEWIRYRLISMRPIYYFDTWAIIWHGIVPVFLKIYTDLQEIFSTLTKIVFVIDIVSEQS